MKTIRSILAVGILCFTAVAAFALPPSKRTAPAKSLRTTEEFSQVRPGDKLALVCKQCDTVTVQAITSKEEAMELCKEGAEIVCSSCNKTFKVVRHGPPGKGGTHTETRIVNDKGEECMFVTKLPN